MKTRLLPLLALLTGFFSFSKSHAQCQFTNSTLELNSIYTDANGNCVVNMNLGFEIDLNNGNKYIFIHLWRAQDYTSHSYTNQNQPKESNILNDALATIILDNDVVNSNPSAPPSQVFMTTYGPDPGIDDNIAPAIGQVKDASDGLSYSRVTANASSNIYRYTIHNLTLVVPGVCTGQMRIRCDAWSSNANNSNPAVQCAMPGLSFLVNDPNTSSNFICMPPGVSNNYSYIVTTGTLGQVSFHTDAYVDNGDGFFDPALDIPVVSNAGPYTATALTPFYSGILTYPAPYSTTSPQRLNNLWVVIKNIVISENNVNTMVSNSLVERVVNTCSAIVLPIKLMGFKGERRTGKVVFNWQVIQSEDITGYVLQRKNDNGLWEDLTTTEAVRKYHEALSYQGEDNFPPADQVLYRLRVTSETGKDEYTPEVLVPALEGNASCSISPNPSRDGTVHIALQQSAGSAEIQLFDLRGRLVQQVKAAGSGRYTFSQLEAGTYFVKVTGTAGNLDIWKKIIVLSGQ